MFVDGFRVHSFQLTDEELLEWFPNEYYAADRPRVKCPLCDDEVSMEDKRSIVTHTRKKHPEAFEKYQSQIIGTPSPIMVAKLLHRHRGDLRTVRKLDKVT
jgi:hypothetical protein